MNNTLSYLKSDKTKEDGLALGWALLGVIVVTTTWTYNLGVCLFKDIIELSKLTYKTIKPFIIQVKSKYFSKEAGVGSDVLLNINSFIRKVKQNFENELSVNTTYTSNTTEPEAASEGSVVSSPLQEESSKFSFDSINYENVTPNAVNELEQTIDSSSLYSTSLECEESSPAPILLLMNNNPKDNQVNQVNQVNQEAKQIKIDIVDSIDSDVKQSTPAVEEEKPKKPLLPLLLEESATVQSSTLNPENLTSEQLKSDREREIKTDAKLLKMYSSKAASKKRKEALEQVEKYGNKPSLVNLTEGEFCKELEKNIGDTVNFFGNNALSIAVLDNFNSENKLYRRFLEARDDIRLNGKAKGYMKNLIKEFLEFVSFELKKG